MSGDSVRVWVGFGVLCLLAGSRWLLDTVVPPALPPLLRSAVDHAVLLVVWCAWLLLRRGLPGWRRGLEVALWSGLLWVVTDAVIAGASGRLGGTTEALVYTLVPVVVVVAAAQQTWEFGAQGDSRGLLGPALAGVCGAVLLLPFTMPGSVAGRVWLGALVGAAVLTGVAAVQLHKLLRGIPLIAAAVIASGVIAGCDAVLARASWSALGTLDARGWLVEGAIALGFEGPVLLLGIWLLRELRPVAFATRYLWILLAAVLESYVLMRPSANWIMGLGALLMAGSAVWLLRASPREDDSGSTLRL